MAKEQVVLHEMCHIQQYVITYTFRIFH